MIPSVIQQIEPEPEPERISVCNNAAWATGEIALQCVGDSSVIEPFIPELMNRLCTILLNPKSQKSLAENAAVTIGRLGLVTPALIAPQLPQFAQAWCTALWEIKDNEEKDSAFRGFCMMIAANPSGIQDVSWTPAGQGIADFLELYVVLQRRLQVATPIRSFGRHVPTNSPRLQIKSRRRMGTARIIIPTSPPTTSPRTIRSLGSSDSSSVNCSYLFDDYDLFSFSLCLHIVRTIFL